MAKKQYAEKFTLKDKEDLGSADFGGLSGDFSSKISGLSSKLFGLVKIILAVIILPFVYSSAVSFSNEFAGIDTGLQRIFWNGVFTFLIIYLFIFEPSVIYSRGHKLLEIVFSFFKPMINVAPFLLPIYTILFFIIFGLLSLGIKSRLLAEYTLFLIGFSTVLHLVFSAKTIRSKKGDFLKANYIFGFSFIFILNVVLLAFGFSLIFNGFSFVNFCSTSFNIAKGIFYACFKQLFMF
ncbi:MAG: hypothetical protein WC442_05795 [Candidatus Omnitrophota bacterium]